MLGDPFRAALGVGEVVDVVVVDDAGVHEILHLVGDLVLECLGDLGIDTGVLEGITDDLCGGLGDHRVDLGRRGLGVLSSGDAGTGEDDGDGGGGESGGVTHECSCLR